MEAKAHPTLVDTWTTKTVTSPSKTWSGYKGVDELAKRLCMKPVKPGDGPRLQLQGESGAFYDIPDMCQRMLDAVESTYEEPKK